MLPIYAPTEQQHSPVHPTFDLLARLAEFFLRWVRGTGHQGLCLATALVAFFPRDRRTRPAQAFATCQDHCAEIHWQAAEAGWVAVTTMSDRQFGVVADRYQL